MKSLARLATVLYIVALPVFLVSANVRFVASDSWFSKDGFRRHHVEETTRVSLPQLDDVADDITRYFEDDRTVLRIPVTINGQETSLFNERETDHMRDVKTLMRAVFRLNEVSLAVILLYVGAVVLWARERTPRDLARYSLFGLALGLLVVGTVGAFAVTGFDAAWTKFHEIAFRNDLWVLDPARDRLIQMFPEPFWEEMTYLVGALTLVEAVAVVSVASLYLLFSKDAREEA
ncbi:MAG TPA: TIGR01906 family membrane protein [Tepidiformaceae bacterium]|nr:TIGR01906 family membrane protein [Tepidiformaceae bacterium]